MSSMKGVPVALLLLCIFGCCVSHGEGHEFGPQLPLGGEPTEAEIHRSDPEAGIGKSIPVSHSNTVSLPRKILSEGATGDRDASRLSGRNDDLEKWVTRRNSVDGSHETTCGCGMKDISISQGRVSSASGIPEYVVQIVNTCMSHDCAPSDVHLYCGWFASPPLVNPNVFRRTEFNDCIINNGKPLRYGEIIRFQYANSFMYPLRLKFARFC